jgi:hypothetical protein
VARAGPQANTCEQFALYAVIIEYNNRQLREEILPLYVEMIGLFTRGYGLAEESTRPHLGILVKCHAMWQRQLSESPLPPGARRAMPRVGPWRVLQGP